MWNSFRSGSVLSMNLCHKITTVAGDGWREPSAGSGLVERNTGCLRLVSKDSIWGSDDTSTSDVWSIAFETDLPVETLFIDEDRKDRRPGSFC